MVRGIAYRRKQEARVFKKRRNFLKAIDGFGPTRCKMFSERWVKRLKNGDFTVGWIGKWGKTYSSRLYRKYSKLVTWKLPEKVFLRRKHIGHEGLRELWMENRE